LYEQRDADECRQKVRHVGDIEDVHQAKVAADVDDVGDGTLVTLSQLECLPFVSTPIDEDSQGWQTEREKIDEYK
jgi:hypothetical protein